MSMVWECVFPGLLYSLGVGFPYPSLKFIPQGPGIPFFVFPKKKACYGWLWVQGPSVYGEEEALMVPRL